MNSQILAAKFSEIDLEDENFQDRNINLAQVSESEAPAPPGFGISKRAFNLFMEKNSLKDNITHLKDAEDEVEIARHRKQVKSLVMEANIPKEMEREVISSYKELKQNLGVDKLRVSVSINIGSEKIYFDASSRQELLKNIKKCYRAYLSSKKFESLLDGSIDELDFPDITVMKKSGDSSVSGRSSSNIKQYGEGNIIEVIEDTRNGFNRYLLFKKDLSIISEEKISGSEKSFLTENQVKEIAKYTYSLEKVTENDVEIFWSLDQENKEIAIKNMIKSNHVGRDSYSVFEFEENTSPLLEGKSVGNGIVRGNVKILNSPNQIEMVSSNDIVVTDNLTGDWEDLVSKVSAVICNRDVEGFVRRFSRNRDSNLITNTVSATSKLENGQEVTLNLNKGKIYDGTPFYHKNVLEKREDCSDKVSLNIDSVEDALNTSFLALDNVLVRSGDLDVFKDELGVIAGSYYPREIRVIMDDKRLRDELENILELYSKGLDNLSVVVPSRKSIKGCKDLRSLIKEILKASDIDVYLFLDTPLSLRYVDDLEDYYDGFVFDYDSITSNLLGLNQDDERFVDLVDSNTSLVKARFVDFANRLKNTDNIMVYCERCLASPRLVEKGLGPVSVDIKDYSVFCETVSGLETSNELELDLSVRIGDPVQEVSNKLDRHDKLSLDSLLIETDSSVDLDLLNQALGWLAKEDSLEVLTDGKEKYYRLR